MKVAFRKKPGSIFAYIIRIWTFGKYSHTELVFSNGRTFSSDEADGGTRWKDWTMSPDEWDFLEIPCTPAQEEALRIFCCSELGSKYDKVGIAFSFLPIPIGWQSAKNWFCSEICVAALQQIGYCIGYTPSSISPNKLYKILREELAKRLVRAAAGAPA